MNAHQRRKARRITRRSFYGIERSIGESIWSGIRYDTPLIDWKNLIDDAVKKWEETEGMHF